MDNNEGKWLCEGTTVYTLMHDSWKKGVEQFRNRLWFGLHRDQATVSEQEAEETPAFIVKACNNHDELVKRLAWAVRFIETYAIKAAGPATPELNKCRALLAGVGADK